VRSLRRRLSLILTGIPLAGLVLAAAACGSDKAAGSSTAAPASSAAPAATTPSTGAPTSSAAPSSTVATSPAPSTTAKVDLSDVTLNVAEANNATQALLAAAGQDQGFPYKVSYVETASTSVSLEGVKGGDIDLFGSGELPGIFGAAAGVPFKLVATYYKNVNATGVLVPKGSSITTVAGLKGKTIAVNAGSNAQKVLYRALATVGLTPDDINLVNLQPADALPAFVAGQLDAWATFDPNTSIAEAKYGATMLVDGSNGIHSGVNFLAAAVDALGDPGKFAAIADFLGRQRAAEDWSAKPENKDAYLALQAKLTKLEPEVTETIYERGPNVWKPISDDVIADTQKTADEFAALGANPKVDLTKFFTEDLNPLLFPEGSA
jgi:sulfonate transport system substrate-binding protein